jgi:hypothetical protein
MNDELTCDLRFIVIRFQKVHIKIFLYGSGIIKLVMLQELLSTPHAHTKEVVPVWL